jgi:hydrogenase nickel incorporation protein HypB
VEERREPQERRERDAHDHDHAGHDHDHSGHDHSHDHGVLEGVVITRTHADTHAARLVRVERDLLSYNAAIAAENRAVFTRDRTFALNLMSSPGAGKTTLLVATLRRLVELSVGVIEGDQATSLDAERIRAAGAPAVQVNTGAGCHLDAGMIARARVRLPSLVDGVLFIENVGNLVCPAAFDLGEARRVVIVSVTEGEDKPLKYPAMFASADLVVITKSDLLPHLDTDVALLVANLDRVAPGVRHLVVSARSGEGLEQWCAWIRAR